MNMKEYKGKKNKNQKQKQKKRKEGGKERQQETEKWEENGGWGWLQVVNNQSIKMDGWMDAVNSYAVYSCFCWKWKIHLTTCSPDSFLFLPTCTILSRATLNYPSSKFGPFACTGSTTPSFKLIFSFLLYIFF